MKKTLVITALTFALIAVAPAAFGASPQTADLAISANVAANCTIATLPVPFGTYDPFAGTPLNASGSVTIACTKGSAPTVGLGLGSNNSGSTRQMVGVIPTNLLAYELYLPPSTTPDTACTFPGSTVWGTSGSNLFTPTAPTSKAARKYFVCGTIAGGLDVGVDSYNDTVVASVNF